jgi:hypothetical protein
MRNSRQETRSPLSNGSRTTASSQRPQPAQQPSGKPINVNDLTGTSPQRFMPPNPPVPSGSAEVGSGPTPANDQDAYLMNEYLLRQYPQYLTGSNPVYRTGQTVTLVPHDGDPFGETAGQ